MKTFYHIEENFVEVEKILVVAIPKNKVTKYFRNFKFFTQKIVLFGIFYPVWEFLHISVGN